MTRFIVLIAALAVCAGAQAQAYPTKPLRVIVSYPPGGGLDSTARLIAQTMSGPLGQSIVVENRVGAGGTVAEEAVSKMEPDGYNLLYTVGSDMASRKYLSRKQALDPNKDLTPLATTIASVSVVLVNASHPAKTLPDLVALAKKDPGKLTFGTPGVQSYYYLIGELFRQNGVDMVHVPYKGTAPIATAVLASEIDVGLLTYALAQPLVAGGKARVLAVLEPRRFPGHPETPSVTETLPGFRAPLSWFGFFGPPGLPQPIVDRLNTEINKALDVPDVRAKIGAQSFNILQMKPAEMRPFITETAELFAKIIKAANIQPYD